MRIQLTDAEIHGYQLTPGTYNFIIKAVSPTLTNDSKGNEATKLILRLESIPDDVYTLPATIDYRITVKSDNAVHQRIGREIFRNIVKAVYPVDWEEKLKDFDVEELIEKQFSSEISYNNQYIQFKKISKSTTDSATKSDIPF